MKITKKKKQTPRQAYYGSIFDALMHIGLNMRFPKKLLKSLDDVADYVGDIAMGRKN